MHIWRTLRNLITYRSLFAASVDREIRRRLGHGDTTEQRFSQGGVLPKSKVTIIGDREPPEIIIPASAIRWAQRPPSPPPH